MFRQKQAHILCSAAFILDPNSMLLFHGDCDACFVKKSRENHFDIPPWLLSMTMPFFASLRFGGITFRAAEWDLMSTN
jgi:hypothetical protein